MDQATTVEDTKPYQTMKHQLDLMVATLVLIILFPLLAVLVLLICLESRGPAVYRQVRVGQFGLPFTIYKFRSMKIDTPVLSTAEMRQQNINPYTRLGALLRKTNLDELPQLFNILKGEMSFVGPRPALPSQTDVNTLRHEMGVEIARPGITGLAQVMGRDDLDTVTKVSHDATYCRNMSFLYDLSILIRTVGAVFTGRGNH